MKTISQKEIIEKISGKHIMPESKENLQEIVALYNYLGFEDITKKGAIGKAIFFRPYSNECIGIAEHEGDYIFKVRDKNELELVTLDYVYSILGLKKYPILMNVWDEEYDEEYADEMVVIGIKNGKFITENPYKEWNFGYLEYYQIIDNIEKQIKVSK